MMLFLTYKGHGPQAALLSTAVFLALLRTGSATTLTTDPTAEIDSLRRVLRHTAVQEDTSNVHRYIELAQLYQKTLTDSAFFFARKALTVSQEQSYPIGIILSQEELAELETRYGDSNQAIAHLRDALRIAKQIQDSARQQNIYRKLGSVYRQKAKYTLSLRYFQKASALAKKLQDTTSLANALQDMGIVYSQMGDFDHAITLFKQALPTHQSLDNHDVLFVLHNNIGLAYDRKGTVDSAQHHHQRALHQAQVSGHKVYEAIALNNIATLHVNIEQYATALPYAERACAIYEEVTKGKCHYAFEDTMGNIYVGLQQYQSAREYYGNALAILEEDNDPTEYIKTLSNLIRLDSLDGKFQQAFVHQQHLTQVKDSLASAENAETAETLKVQYETERKDQEITLLQAQTDRQQLEARQQRFVKNSFIAGSIGLCLLLGLGYNRYRFKQRALGVMRQQKEEITQQKQQVERKHHENQLLLKEVHHRVKNNLQIVLSILNAQADNLRDPTTVAAIRESQHRVHSMALIHQSLYQSDDLSQIQAQQYLHEMVETVCRSYYAESQPVRLHLQVEDVAMDMSTAVPVGLIVTELVTNACKYGLSSAHGELSVTLRAETATQYRLTVADNGPGLPPDFDLAQSDSLGLQLVQGLAQQLDGELVVQNRSGACFNLLFQQAA